VHPVLCYSAVCARRRLRQTGPLATFTVQLGTLLGAAGLATAALWQAGTARKRHAEQTTADRERRITESFAKAVELLGSDKIEARLGAIYTLERISKEKQSEHDYYWPIMETLTAFVREHAPWPPPLANPFVQLQSSTEDELAGTSAALITKPKEEIEESFRLIPIIHHGFPVRQSTRAQNRPAADIQAVLTILVGPDAGRKRIAARRRLDLAGKDLRGAKLEEALLEGSNLSGVHLEGAWLSKAHLREAQLARAHLEDSFLMEAHLEGSNFSGAHLQGATLWRAHLQGTGGRSEEWPFDFEIPAACLMEANLEQANLSEAHLEGSNLSGAHLQGAHLWKAHLQGAHLSEAHLEDAGLGGANLEDAHLRKAHVRGTKLQGARLWRAHLDGVDLQGAVGLTQEQLDTAFGDDRTLLPEGLTRPAHWLAAAPDAPDNAE
jgi:uncharacterized protein YjbI with pentapeptide repeats